MPAAFARASALFAIGLLLASCNSAPKETPSAPVADSNTDSLPPDTLKAPDKSKLTSLPVTNSAIAFPGPAGVIVMVPTGCKTKPSPIYEGMTTKWKDRKVPEDIVTPSGARATMQYGFASPDQKSVTGMDFARFVKSVPRDGSQIVARPWVGYFREGTVEPTYAKISKLEGEWGQRMYIVARPDAILMLTIQWPAADNKAKTEAIELAEAIIFTVAPDPKAKGVDFFPGAGSESNKPIPPGTEIAMPDGMILEATTSVGKMRIEAGPQSKRSYTWEGATRSVIMGARRERWYGSKGLGYPGPGNHWVEHNGIARGVLEEGQQHFKSVKEAMDWLGKRKYMPFVYNNKGLVVGWNKVLERQQLGVEVWQIMINGKKPTALPGSTDDKIVIVRAGSK